jgi:hypothetical protein
MSNVKIASLNIKIFYLKNIFINNKLDMNLKWSNKMFLLFIVDFVKHLN